MPTILYSPASPYSAKVRMAAAHAGIACEAVVVDTNADPALLVRNNPLGKIPVLVPDDEPAIYDSRAITQYLNRKSGNALFPRNAAKRTDAERLEALADGIADCLLAIVYERRFRPEERIHQPWLDRQWSKVERSLDLRATLGYMSLRFGGKWEKGRSKLTRWAKKFDAKFPELAQLTPR
jgi:glutathione S-transferase